MKILDPEYKSIMVNRLPLVYHLASSKGNNQGKNFVTVKEDKTGQSKKMRVVPFYKVISKPDL